MKPLNRYLVVAAGFAAVHFLVMWIAFTKSAVIRPSQNTSSWRELAEVLSFPMVYLSRAVESADVLLPLMILNSALWGGAAAACLAVAGLVLRGAGGKRGT